MTKEDCIKKLRDMFLQNGQTDAIFMSWLDVPNGDLGESTPNELIASGRGHKVINLMEAVFFGY